MSIDWSGYLGEGAGGATLGAGIGSFIPGIGTAIGAGLGGGLGLLHHFLGEKEGGGANPYVAAQQQTEKGWKEAQGYQSPYATQGLAQYPGLNQATSDLLNPEALENKWAGGYQNSPWANQLLSQNQSAGLDAASAMGLGGSSAAIGNIQQGAANVFNQQRQQYMNDLMEKYMHGIGLGQSLYGTGAAAAGNLGEQANLQGLNMALLGYGKAAGNEQLLGNELALGGNLLAKQYFK